MRPWVTLWRNRAGGDNWALLPLRLMIGFGFAAHGYAKLARGPATFAPIVAALGLPAPAFTAWVTSLIELGGGILLMLGAFVVPLSLPLAAMTAVAMFGVHLRYGFLAIKLKTLSAAGAEFGPPGYEITLLYLAGIATLVLSGSTPLSIDRLLESRRSIDEVSRPAQAGASGERAANVPLEPERAA
ncbi:MAG: DoxX family protein [Deltaproteobacteria bacterium]|nr:MAG: DoxX family protein [Deltaproteobacteria bacterium]